MQLLCMENMNSLFSYSSQLLNMQIKQLNMSIRSRSELWV